MHFRSKLFFPKNFRGVLRQQGGGGGRLLLVMSKLLTAKIAYFGFIIRPNLCKTGIKYPDLEPGNELWN